MKLPKGFRPPPGTTSVTVNPQALASCPPSTSRPSRASGGAGTNGERAGGCRTKYHSEPVIVEGVRWASKREWRRWSAVLFPLFQAGRIGNLRRQVRFPLTTACRRTGKRIQVATLIVDFVYEEHGRLTVEDAKGFRTESYLTKKRWLLAEYGLTIREV